MSAGKKCNWSSSGLTLGSSWGNGHATCRQPRPGRSRMGRAGALLRLGEHPVPGGRGRLSCSAAPDAGAHGPRRTAARVQRAQRASPCARSWSRSSRAFAPARIRNPHSGAERRSVFAGHSSPAHVVAARLKVLPNTAHFYMGPLTEGGIPRLAWRGSTPARRRSAPARGSPSKTRASTTSCAHRGGSASATCVPGSAGRPLQAQRRARVSAAR